TTGSLTINTSITNATGNVTLGTGGGTATQSIRVGGNLNITTNNRTIQDDNDSSPFVVGSTNLNTNSSGTGGANITLNAAHNNVSGTVTGRFGQLNANAGTGSLAFSENTLANVGNITVGSSSTIRSVNGDIVINGSVVVSGSSTGILWNASSGNITQGATGTLNLAGTSAWNASNTAGFGTNLSSTTNVFGGNVAIINGNNDIFVAASNFGFTPGNVTSGNLSVTTVNPGNNVTINGGNMTNVTINSAGRAAINGGVIRNLSITANDTSSTAVTTGGNFTLNGTLTLNTPGNATIGAFNSTTSVANITGNVVLANVTGDVAVHSSRNLTISGLTRGNLTVSSGTSPTNSFANPWGLAFGNLTAGSLNAIAGNGATFVGSNFDPTNGISGNITQLAGSSLHIEGNLTVSPFGGNIVLMNAGNSAGRVNLYTNGNLTGTGTLGGNISYMEDSTIKVGNVTGNGTVTLSSAFGSIIEDPAVFTNLVSNNELTLNAPNGSILLGNTTRTAAATTGNFSTVNLTAAGAANILSSANVTLGNVSANSLAVTGNRITQSAPLNIFGVSSFTATGNLGVVLDNASNNFGPVAINLTAVNAPATVVEGNTLNLRTVTMLGGGNGTLSLTSLNGDITDSGLGGVKLGGNATTTGSGVVTLNATNGNITIDDPTSDFLTTSGTVFTGKNVTFSILGSALTSLVLGSANVSSTATGNFSATSALGSITNAGAFNVTGNAFFQTTSGGISINQPGVNFGSLKFIGNTVSIIEASDMVIQTGSQALGAADLRSGGNITIDNSGGGSVTFGSIAGFLASGNITLRNTQALNTITVTASGNKDLSQLSLSTDLNNKTPVDLGAGSGPSTNPAFAPKP
ncbi:MAG: S-layer family protein, partial [Opitutaceae bacterium]|nr:S-layer family protein [Opitutaceae bacterium]